MPNSKTPFAGDENRVNQQEGDVIEFVREEN
jgi:hypothetical protein